MFSASSLARDLTRRDLVQPLLSSVATKPNKSDATNEDEDSHPKKWYNPAEHEEDDAPPEGSVSTRSRTLYKYRKLLAQKFEIWGRPVAFLKYLVYLIFAGLVAASETKHETDPVIRITGLFTYAFWLLLFLTDVPSLFLGGRQTLAWGGVFSQILITLLYLCTIILATDVFKAGSHAAELLLLSMSVTLFVDRKVVEPKYRTLYWYYHGVISADGVGTQPHISGIGSSTVKKVATNACNAVGISKLATKSIENILHGVKIRRGKEEESLDDMTLLIHRLSKVVSFAPSFFRAKSAMSTCQYHSLVCQMIIYMRSYMQDGKIELDETILKRSTPLSLGEVLTIMTKFSMQVPWSFLVATIPMSLNTVATSALAPYGNILFIGGLYAGDISSARTGFMLIVLVFVITPILNVLANIAESYYSSRMVAQLRREMFNSLMKGGTIYDDTHRPGAVINAFSNHLNQVLLFGQTFFIRLVPSVVGLIAGVAFSGLLYPFAVVLFITIVPVVLSVEHFVREASEASAIKAQTEANVMGKISSAVECRKAIRASNAGSWVSDDVKDLFESLREASRNMFLRSNLSQNFMEFAAYFYIVLILIPLGIGVLEGKVPVDTFIALSQALTALVMPLFMLGSLQSQTMIYSASIQAVKDLMDNSLDEEPVLKSGQSKKKGNKTTMLPLLNSVKVRDVKFRYSAHSPDVLKGVQFDLDKGTYTVICGESGSGKTTALNLLMRFYKPDEGSIEWDENSIYSTSLGSFRENVSVMFQRTMIYQASIRDNILFGLPEEPGGVEKAARDAEIADVISHLPDGYDTVIGGDAVAGMSGGQLQRICMARSLYRKPSVLLLDEATSALDKETERSIIETLVRLRDHTGITLVSVSHHPNTAIEADNIVVMAGGVVSEEGTYEELVSREGGIFRRIVGAGK